MPDGAGFQAHRDEGKRLTIHKAREAAWDLASLRSIGVIAGWKGGKHVVDQKEAVIYTRNRSLYSWRAKRLLVHKGYAFEVLDTTDGLNTWLTHSAGRDTGPSQYETVRPRRRRPVGGFGDRKDLDRSGNSGRLVRGEV